VIGGSGILEDSADARDALTLVKKLISLSQLADDLYSFGEAFGYGALAFAFHGASVGKVWPIGKLS
jgi:hypothetical protein